MEGAGDGVLEIWPENARAVQVFEDMATSWNEDNGSVVGLRYEALLVFLDINEVPRSEWRQTLDGIKTMELAAANALNKRRA